VQGLSILKDPETAQLYTYAFLAGLPVVIMCGVLSVLVVVKRLGFVGQGISHSAFGGVGLAAVLAAIGWLPRMEPWAGPAQLMVVAAFCVLGAWGMGMVSDRRTLPVDTAIGVFLVGSMAAGAIMVQAARTIAERNGRPGIMQTWESILFGSIVGVGPMDAIVGAATGAVVLAGAWWVRRPLLFWCLDEESSRAFGIRTRIMKLVLMTLLAIAVVTAMKLTGVILATALLALPGATALRLSSRLYVCIGLSVLISVIGLLGGLLLSIATDWPAGPGIVVVLAAMFAAAMVYAKASARAATAPSPA